MSPYIQDLFKNYVIHGFTFGFFFGAVAWLFGLLINFSYKLIFNKD